jgi:hypothetical protein
MAVSTLNISDFRKLTPQQLKDHLEANSFDTTITTKLEGTSLSFKKILVFHLHALIATHCDTFSEQKVKCKFIFSFSYSASSPLENFIIFLCFKCRAAFPPNLLIKYFRHYHALTLNAGRLAHCFATER